MYVLPFPSPLPPIPSSLPITNHPYLQTGGVTLTLSLTYLALHTHSQNRLAQSTLLRHQATSLDNLLPPDELTFPDGRRRRRNTSYVSADGTVYRPRESLLLGASEEGERRVEERGVTGGERTGGFLETAKERWNAEVLGAARWAQNKDWGRVREEAEEGVARLLGVELSKEVVTEREEVPSRVSAPAERARREERRDRGLPPPPPELIEAGEKVRERTMEGAKVVRDEVKEAVSKGVGGAKGMVAKGMDKAHEFVESAKTALYLAEEKAETRMDARLLHRTAVEKALEERFDSELREKRMKRSVEEVLRERYMPMDKRDNSRLRGI